MPRQSKQTNHLKKVYEAQRDQSINSQFKIDAKKFTFSALTTGLTYESLSFSFILNGIIPPVKTTFYSIQQCFIGVLWSFALDSMHPFAKIARITPLLELMANGTIAKMAMNESFHILN